MEDKIHLRPQNYHKIKENEFYLFYRYNYFRGYGLFKLSAIHVVKIIEVSASRVKYITIMQGEPLNEEEPMYSFDEYQVGKEETFVLLTENNSYLMLLESLKLSDDFGNTKTN